MQFRVVLMVLAGLNAGSAIAADNARLRSVETFGYFYALAEALEAKCIDARVELSAKNGAFSDNEFLSDEEYSEALDIADGLHEKAKSDLAGKSCADARIELMKYTELPEAEVFQ